ncbi:LOW QUALITY PROTEIN: AP-3 complex subunit beta-2-like [Dermacentor silvarum]|uniref:LOW QUALITY PROTEIN: AP-3 complex subunit beta-2-like n=1 Tax=Dermacentor silvarum TaxID=543639 RepID=UPI00189813BC|nr:LOW QUALITY PROTEIN: AP-3 complex subunit beta-2-like [Dermacentor silvarum]
MIASWAYKDQLTSPSAGGQMSAMASRHPNEAGDAAAATATESVPGFFSSDLRRHEDLKNMLDSSKDGLKLEAMKRIIGMIAKGKDASELFPAVVKNVVSKNLEVKKLVYVYLVRYAEEQQDLALLSISTFQRALRDPNQLIRASALRVLSSIRVPVIVPIMMLAIKDAVSDMSPYVRKTAAHAIPKLYRLDPEQKEQLVEVIEKLLADKTTLVVGSAVMAFDEVCPERIDLVHRNYRKLCNLLVDVEEWGQVEIILMLTRYARTQFVDPNAPSSVAGADDADDAGRPGVDDDEDRGPAIDPDLRLLLRNCKPLLQSRNSAVVMAVAQLYYHLAPRAEVALVVKSLIRLLRSHREIQTVVLSNVATMSIRCRGLFEPFLRSFFVRSSDPTHIKLLKLEVLTNLAGETNVPVILREFQTYVASSDTEFVAATIQSIGRCASTIPEVADTCLNGLVALLSNRNEAVVAESVVVIKKLLQMKPSEHRDIIGHMAKLMDSIAVPMARASILWLLGEYADRVPKIAPDVLRKVAKTFIQEEDIVKLQTLNLAAKLYLTNSKQTKLITQYVFSLAKYDPNYDIRDRVRFLRQLVMPQGDTGGVLHKHAKKFLLASKPAPVLQSKYEDRDHYQIGSLSHFINGKANGYQELPDFPEVAPDTSVRNVEVPTVWQEAKSSKKKKQVVKKKSFYSETDSSHSADESSSGSSDGSSDEETASGSETESDDSERVVGESSDESGSGDSRVNGTADAKSAKDSSASSSSESEESDASSSSSEAPVAKPKKVPASRSNLDLLLDLDDMSTAPIAATLQPMSALTVTAVAGQTEAPRFVAVSTPAHVPAEWRELLNKVSGAGLAINYRFTRTPHLFSPKMASVEVTLANHGEEELPGVQITDRLGPGISSEVRGIASEPLAPGATRLATLGIDFGDSTQLVTLEVVIENGARHTLTLQPPVGEILRPVRITHDEFLAQQGRLRGMNEHSCSLEKMPEVAEKVRQRVHRAANVLAVEDEQPGWVRFAGQTLASRSLVLVTVRLPQGSAKATLTVNCDKMVVGSMLMQELRTALS